MSSELGCLIDEECDQKEDCYRLDPYCCAQKLVDEKKIVPVKVYVK